MVRPILRGFRRMGTTDAGHGVLSQTRDPCHDTVYLVPTGLKRYYDGRSLHFITTSCHHRRARLGIPARRTLLLKILEEVRRRYGFVVVGYVIMPEHIHLLISEPERGDPSVVMQVLKQRVARRILRQESQKRRDSRTLWLWEGDRPKADPFWQVRFYDFVVWSEKKKVEKLRYMHRNPVKRGLVLEPEQWAWSSYRHYAFGERGIVLVNEEQPAVMRIRDARDLGRKVVGQGDAVPTLRKARRVGQPRNFGEGWATHIRRIGCTENS